MLHTTLGATRLLARPGDRRLWLLDAGTAALWDLYIEGWTGELLTELLATRFGLAPDVAHAYLDRLLAQWRAAGLLAGAAADQCFAPMEILPRLPRSDTAPTPPGAWRLRLADRVVHLAITDFALHAGLEPLLAPLITPPPATEYPSSPASPDDWLAVQGDASHWTLIMNGVGLETGHGHDAALVATLTILTELGCRTRERLLVAHSAGLVAPDGRGLLLIAPGGSGKSTLAAALNAAGYGWLSDDVVPVTPDGALVGLGLPLCLKAGSWPVLAACRPDLDQAPVVHRFGQAVRYLPPCGPAVTSPLKPARLLFPRFHPGQAPRHESLSPEQALRGLVEAEAVIRDLTQTKLEALACWVSAAPADALTYPDLDSSLTLVRAILETPPAESTTCA